MGRIPLDIAWRGRQGEIEVMKKYKIGGEDEERARNERKDGCEDKDEELRRSASHRGRVERRGRRSSWKPFSIGSRCESMTKILDNDKAKEEETRQERTQQYLYLESRRTCCNDYQEHSTTETKKRRESTWGHERP